MQEARRLGIAVFGVTIDAAAQSYFPTSFGRSGYAIVGDIRHSPAALPAICRQPAIEPRKVRGVPVFAELLLIEWVYDRMPEWTRTGENPI